LDFQIEMPSADHRYRVLLGVGRALAGVLQEGEIYASIHREIARVVATDGFYIALHDTATDGAEVVYWADRGDASWTPVPYRGSASEVIARGEGVLVDDRLDERGLFILGDPATGTTRSAISVPLRAGGKIIGVISVQSYQADTYDPEELELLQAIGDLAAVAIQNARHVSELDRRRREAERILELARTLTSSLDDREVLRRIVDAARELLATEGAAVWLLEEEGMRVGASAGRMGAPEGACFPLEGKLFRMVAEDRETVTVEDLPATDLLPPDIRRRLRGESALIVPLVSGERVMGALSVTSEQPRGFQREEARLLQRLGGHAALALENAHLHARLRALSLTDPLTGLPNRRHLELHLSQEFAAARRGRPLTMVLFDLDDFKGYNDTMGHLAGDDALRAVGEILSGETRAMNLVARYGGDEFVAVLSDTSAEGGRHFAERVQERLRRHPALKDTGISFSSGVAEFSAAMGEVMELVDAADRNLYRAKAHRSSHIGRKIK
jgi:two-component system, cell cycle response regulator